MVGSVQAPSAVVLVRPHHFRPNPQTVGDNRFQSPAHRSVSRAAFDATTIVARRLEDAGVTVHRFEDETRAHPDSVFPNNWLSTHAGGRVAVYPMYAPNRRGERRDDVIDLLKREYRVREVVDYSGFEHEGVFLEGTGAMVLDHAARVAYTARSRRADPALLERFCTTFGYEPLLFDAVDQSGVPIYHTNVMMCIATEFALIALDTIPSMAQRENIVARLAESGRHVVALSNAQLHEFAGNAIELSGRDGRRLLALSTRAEAALRADQRAMIERSCRLLPLDVTPIELAGGSVRCMIAGIHLDPRPASTMDAAPEARAEYAVV